MDRLYGRMVSGLYHRTAFRMSSEVTVRLERIQVICKVPATLLSFSFGFWGELPGRTTLAPSVWPENGNLKMEIYKRSHCGECRREHS